MTLSTEARMAHAVRQEISTARRLAAVAVALVVLGACAGGAARGEEKMDQLLPKRIAGWSAAGADRHFTRDNIFEYMDGAGEIYLAYDFQRLLVREYEKRAAPRIIAEVYQMSSSEDAYGIFSHDTDGQPVTLGQGAIYAAGLLRFWKDRIFVRVLAEKETGATQAAVMALGKSLDAAIPRAGKKPRLLTGLPLPGLLKESVRYFHTRVSLNAHYFLADSNLLNLSPKTEVVLARYLRNGRKVRLLLCHYADAAAAKAAFEQFNKIYFRDRPAPKSPGRIEKVERGEFVSARWNEAFLILVFEARDPKTCEALTDAVLGRVKEVLR
jgi:hypothetical protein